MNHLKTSKQAKHSYRSFRNKRAVSPIVATVLLMAFAVALGAIVMTWGKEYVQTTTEDIDVRTVSSRTCTLDVNIEIKRIGASSTLCYDASNPSDRFIQFVLSNKGNDIEDVDVVIVDENNDVFSAPAKVLSTSLKQAGARKIIVPYADIPGIPPDPPTVIGIPTQVVITPKIGIAGQQELTFCTEKSIEEDLIPPCKPIT